MSKTDQALKLLGAGTLLFGVLPLVGIVLRELPGGFREIKDLRMGMRGGWHQAH
jgi:hypothetical protein